MKKISLLIGLCILMGGMANAQKPDDGMDHHYNRRMRGHHRTDLSRALNFTDQQKQQWASIRQDFRKKMSDLNKNESITVKESRDQRAALIKEERKSFQNLLTPEQEDKLTDMKKRAEGRRKDMAARRADKMKTRLGLSEDQSAKIKTIDDRFRDDVKKYREDESMSRSDKRDRLMSLHKQHNDDIQSVLTPDQHNKMEEWRKEKTGRF